MNAAVMIVLPVKPVRTHNMCKEASAKTTTTIKSVFVDAKIQTCTRFRKISGLGFSVSQRAARLARRLMRVRLEETNEAERSL